MEEVRFTYVVNPRRPIKGIQDMPSIKSSKTLKLTKEEALLCMKCGPVYRKFANEGIQERVTGANIDRLHNEKFISEKEFSGNNIPVIENKEAVETVVSEPAKVNEPVAAEAQSAKVEAPVVTEPVPVVENVVEEVAPVEEEVAAEEPEVVEEAQSAEDTDDENNTEVSTSEEVVESSDSEATDEDKVDEGDKEAVKDNQPIVVDYNGNRKKKKHH